MQSAVKLLTELGPLPSSELATEQGLEKYEALFDQVQTPVSDDEAHVLVRLFGPDDCFGLAWTLLHLIETAPDWPIEKAMSGLHNDWIDLLRERAT